MGSPGRIGALEERSCQEGSVWCLSNTAFNIVSPGNPHRSTRFLPFSMPTVFTVFSHVSRELSLMMAALVHTHLCAVPWVPPLPVCYAQVGPTLSLVSFPSLVKGMSELHFPGVACYHPLQ